MSTNSSVLFPLDPNCRLESNFIKNELHTVSSSRVSDYNLIIPKYAPFYIKDLEVRFKGNNNSAFRKLKYKEDYTFGLYFKGGTELFGYVSYGCIMLNDPGMEGVIQLDYRTIGGDYLVDIEKVMNKLIETVWNPREKDWAHIAGVPPSLPPIEHFIDWNDITNLGDLLAKLDEVVDAIANGHLKTNNTIEAFLKTIDVKEFKLRMKQLDEHVYTEMINKVNLLTLDNLEMRKRLSVLEGEVKTLKSK